MLICDHAGSVKNGHQSLEFPISSWKSPQLCRTFRHYAPCTILRDATLGAYSPSLPTEGAPYLSRTAELVDRSSSQYQRSRRWVEWFEFDSSQVRWKSDLRQGKHGAAVLASWAGPTTSLFCSGLQKVLNKPCLLSSPCPAELSGHASFLMYRIAWAVPTTGDSQRLRQPRLLGPLLPAFCVPRLQDQQEQFPQSHVSQF
ncbi:hypothetical protein VTK56DRAFT_9519 [Thermocarpiscus australiensis]